MLLSEQILYGCTGEADINKSGVWEVEIIVPRPRKKWEELNREIVKFD